MSRTKLAVLALSLVVATGRSPEAAFAETRTAAALTPEAVWDAINAAKDGDTVLLPAGTAVWSKGWNDGHGAKMKAITIQGAGIDKTVIGVDQGMVAHSGPFLLLGVEGKPFRVTGITFDGSGFPYGKGGGLMTIGGTCKNFRIDHCNFMNSDRMLGINSDGRGDPYGLVDHCRFEAQKSHGGNVQPIDLAGPGGDNYRKPLTLGTDQAIYFEDNEVYIGDYAGTGGGRSGNNPWIAPHHASRIVVRHNKLVNTRFELYTPGMNKQYGSQQCEIYDNDCSTEGAATPGYLVTVAAGVAIVFNNTMRGTDYLRNLPIIELQEQRAWRDRSGFPKADGKNPLDGNEIPAGQLAAGYPCMGQVGRATQLKGSGSFDSTPCYAWNNTLNGSPTRMGASHRATANEAAMIKEGRDFFNEKPPEGYYKPYVYPHPLQEDKTWDALMKSAAGPGNSTEANPASKP